MTKKHIYVYSPSGAVRDKKAFARGIKRLKQLGYEVEIDSSALASYQRFAGDDTARVAAIHRAATSGADVALMTRGGYGLTRILPALNYKALAKSVERGTRFIGLSDFTALQNALLAKTGAVTWAGPLLNDDFGCEGEPDDIMQACFDDVTHGRAEGAGWRLSKSAMEMATKKPTSGKASLQIDFKNAVLWGGNLSVLVTLIGTPYLPLVKGGILFLEDVGEHPYRVERMLTQLLYAGILAQQKAVLIGQFSHYKSVAHDRGFKLQTVLQRLSDQITAPVFSGLPLGHVPTKVLLPVGASIRLVIQQQEVLLLW